MLLRPQDDPDTAQESTVDLMSDRMDEQAAISEQDDQNWGTICAAIKVEIDRLVMWKFDVFQRKLIPALKEDSPVYSIICESILGVGDILKSRRQYITMLKTDSCL